MTGPLMCRVDPSKRNSGGSSDMTPRLSGFPEFEPTGRIIELSILDQARRVFELHGFASIETRAVEPLSALQAGGETAKEIYAVSRAADRDVEASIGLHFDLTVPLARYVIEHSHDLDFPFRRYQIQKVWRGERPQEGRFREFTQADIDVIGKDSLPFHHDVDLALVMLELLAQLPIPAPVLLVSNRKLAEGFYRGLGVTDVVGVLRCMDKLEKVGPDSTRNFLTDVLGLSQSQAEACLALSRIETPDESFIAQVQALGVRDPMLDAGLAELAAVIQAGAGERPGSIRAALRIARGLDYYTGTVYETLLSGMPQVGSVASGGRYDELARDGRTTFPGVGISLGVTRLMSVILAGGNVQASRAVPSAVLIAVWSEGQRSQSNAIAQQLRRRGIPAEVSPSDAKIGRQIRHAERRGIPFVWFPATEDESDSIKDIRSGIQTPADAAMWEPDAQDLWPRVSSTTVTGV